MNLHTYAGGHFVPCDDPFCDTDCAKCHGDGRIWVKDLPDLRVPLVLILLAILLAVAFLTYFLHAHVLHTDPRVETVFTITVGDLDNRGRLPMTGATAGLLNNLIQTVTGRPRALGCGGQAEVLYTRLEGKVPGWTFAMRYEVGPTSPILLPHQWVEGRGPCGEVVELDPWMGEIR